MKNTIIYLIGFPGVGKYTIAKEIVNQANFRLVDNHLINIPLFSLIQTDGKLPPNMPQRLWDNVRTIWDAVLDTIIHLAPLDYSYVLTNALFESNENDRSWWKTIEKTANTRKALFIPVRLLCSPAEHTKRIMNVDRIARLKMRDEKAPEQYASRSEDVVKIDHPNVLTLNVSNLSPQQAAEAILNHARVCQNS